ncbi:hypothetical protein GOP47_0024704 [Adiantum capillus-veneris]|uniref:Methyltransferase small domain-containing protein n=1 Tax=Adiantum capillus-veneris TaxID=13818 RepID=A0A9D4U4I8_ADICA|nr:hypothetical protein GOP47_0024704 [Adiantum capillus-veneris]
MKKAFTVVSSHRVASRTAFRGRCLSFASSAKSAVWSSSPRNLHVQCSSSNTLPLCERRAVHTSSLEELRKWRSWAQDKAVSVGDKYRIADGGPDSHDLLRELEWMLEDVVSHVPMSSSPHCMPNGSKDCQEKQPNTFLNAETYDGPSETLLETLAGVRHVQHADPLRALKWRDIKNFEPSDFQRVVYLRASLEELSTLWTERVQHRRPFQYVVGCAHWRDFVLFVKEGVLIPRPETEQMIDLAQDLIDLQPNLAKGLWADLGTGSGALAIGLGSILHPQGNIVAVDVSDEALFIASLNIQRYELQDKIRVLKGSWFSPLEDLKGKLAGVLSNPPYIPSSHIATLQAEVGCYEPKKALDGGQQGTDDLTCICEGASWALQSGGYMILETNGGVQAETVANVLDSMAGGPFCDIQLVKDYAGIVRFVKAMHV